MKINVDDLVFKFKFRDDGDFPAQVTVTIGQFEVRGFAIRKTNFPTGTKRHALYPPAKSMGGGKWLHIVRAPEKGDWQKFEDIVLEQFDKEYTDYLMTKLNSGGNPDNINF